MHYLSGWLILKKLMIPKSPSDLELGITQSIAFGIAGSVVTRDPNQKHIALIYRSHTKKLMLLHLGWHHQLHHTDWDSNYQWLEFDGLDIELQESFADWAVLVAGAEPGNPIPYGLVFNGDKSFDEKGQFIDHRDGSGLTCATFLLALFSDFGLPLVNLADWPIKRGGDYSWVRKILSKLRRGYLSNSEWLEQVMRRHSLKRFRPEEVFVTASYFSGSPLEFNIIESEGRRVLGFLTP